MATGFGIEVGHRGIELLHVISHIAQVMTVAREERPAVVDHQEGAAGHLPVAPGQVDNRCGAGSHAKHLGGDLMAVFFQTVVDGDAFEHVTARRVDVYGYIPLADGPQSGIDSFKRDTLAVPVFADHAVHRDSVRGVLYGRLNRGIPFVERARAHLAAQAARLDLVLHGLLP
ncbi:hypothetical protein D9M71_482920 [compost metagenome]